MSEPLKAPFPWFGGKSRAAELIWPRLGDVPNYSEPFAGSLAVLLRRPHAPGNEIINDLDCYVANAWRAIKQAPDAVAAHCDWPVNEADLHARHRWLHGRAEFRLRMENDPDYFDPKIAAWWIWGLSCWIGDAFCRVQCGSTPHLSGAKGVAKDVIDRRRPHVTGGKGVARKVPHLSGGQVVARQVPCGTSQGAQRLGNLCDSAKAESQDAERAGRGPDPSLIGCAPPESAASLGREGRGPASADFISPAGLVISRQIPNITGTYNAKSHRGMPSGKGVSTSQAEALQEWFARLSDRLRFTKVCCGDWARVCTKAATYGHGISGVLLDPPYAREERDPNIYSHEVDGLSDQVREWAIANGDNPLMRIALCGYEGEHKMPETWQCVPWKASGGYANRNAANQNAHRERIWFSPHCLRPEAELFEMPAA